MEKLVMALGSVFLRPLVSVIVPVYSVEDCLVRCLDSICRQSLTQIEVLLIDDASPDRCGEICETYAAQDERVKVFHNLINCGLSVARNIGIANAHGQYLMFVDSDDWVHKDFCKDAYECAIHYQADLVIFRCKRVNNTETIRKDFNKIDCFFKGKYITKLEAIDLLEKDVNVGHFAWNKLYKRELFQHIHYPPDYLCEDGGTTYKAVWKATRIYYLEKVLYFYCCRECSITRTKTKKYLNDLYELAMMRYKDLATWGYPEDKLDTLLKNIALGFCVMKRPDITDDRYVYCANILQTSRNIPDLTRRRQILFILFKYCRSLFELVCNLCKKRIY